MRFRREIGEKGQVVIPKDIREMLGLRPGNSVIFEVGDNEVKVRAERSAEEIVEDFCDTPKIKRGKKSIKEMILEQYDEEIP